jgi:nucleotide-binding universal stress UspA family protein
MGEDRRVIVCGVDGSVAGQRALRWALDEAVRSSGRVRAVTAWEWDGVEELGGTTMPAEALAHARAVLDKAVDEALDGMENAPELERVCERGVPSAALCSAALGADLLVVGSHGHGAVHDKLLGSTSERVVRHAPCAVLIVPDQAHVERNLKRARQRQRTTEPSHPVQVV